MNLEGLASFTMGKIKILAITSAASIGGLAHFAKSDPEAEAARVEATKSPLIGHWSSIVTVGRAGPAEITTITINEDGTYHWLDIEIAAGETNMDDPDSYLPNGAELDHSTGWVDLETGKERISNADRKLSAKSVTWAVKQGKLHWYMDMGNMGGQGMIYSRVH